jgi:hypothetical protein
LVAKGPRRPLVRREPSLASLPPGAVEERPQAALVEVGGGGVSRRSAAGQQLAGFSSDVSCCPGGRKATKWTSARSELVLTI